MKQRLQGYFIKKRNDRKRLLRENEIHIIKLVYISVDTLVYTSYIISCKR